MSVDFSHYVTEEMVYKFILDQFVICHKPVLIAHYVAMALWAETYPKLINMTYSVEDFADYIRSIFKNLDRKCKIQYDKEEYIVKISLRRMWHKYRFRES